MAQDYYVTPAPKASLVTPKTLLIGGGLVVAIIIGVTLLLGTGGNTMSKQLQHLSLRIGSLVALLEDSSVKKNIKNEDLLQISTELRLSLTSKKSELTPLMLAAGMPEKFDKNIIASEADTSTEVKLEEAFLNNKFDRTYADTLSQKIISLRALVAETHRMSKNTKLKKLLVAFDNDLSSIKKRIDKLSL